MTEDELKRAGFQKHTGGPMPDCYDAEKSVIDVLFFGNEDKFPTKSHPIDFDWSRPKYHRPHISNRELLVMARDKAQDFLDFITGTFEFEPCSGSMAPAESLAGDLEDVLTSINERLPDEG